MGQTPIPRVPVPQARPTRLEAAKQAYVDGRVALDEFESHVAKLLAAGEADEPALISPPPKPSDAPRSVTPVREWERVERPPPRDPGKRSTL